MRLDETVMTNRLIAYCGLDCEACEAGKGYETCADCPDKGGCEMLVPFLGNEEAKKNLGL